MSRFFMVQCVNADCPYGKSSTANVTFSGLDI